MASKKKTLKTLAKKTVNTRKAQAVKGSGIVIRNHNQVVL